MAYVIITRWEETAFIQPQMLRYLVRAMLGVGEVGSKKGYFPLRVPGPLFSWSVTMDRGIDDADY